jgi:hypothetical protein
MDEEGSSATSASGLTPTRHSNGTLKSATTCTLDESLVAPHPGSTWNRLPVDGDSSRLIRTRCTRDLFPGSNARVYFHAFGRSGCLAGMCYADLRDQPSTFIRIYRTDVFGHSTSTNPENQELSLRYSKSWAWFVLYRTSDPRISAALAVAQVSRYASW